jgi:acetylornithine deacetylase/succinyl-diaminopimelate desuccinylase-like protein
VPGSAAPASTVYSYIDENADRFVEELRALIRHPSRTGFLDELAVAAEYVAGVGRAAGWSAEVVRVDELAPIVYLERPGPPGSPTLLLYSHYDVISPEPISEWTYPPFDATLVDGKIIGRGATDAKANVMSLIKAVESLVATRGEVPCGVKLMLDGEEERGSTNLPAFVDGWRDRLGADAALSFDGSIDPSGVPKVGLGTSGMLYVDMEVRGARKELHSAGARLYLNPAWRLTWALASIKGPDEQVLIDGFYDPVILPTERDRELMAAMPWNDQRQLDDAGLPSFLTGVSGLAAIERLLYQPGLAICGLTSGFSGEGPKAVIPTVARAKLEFRIVPNQTPEQVLEQLRRHLLEHGFDDVEVTVLATVETAQTSPTRPSFGRSSTRRASSTVSRCSSRPRSTPAARAPGSARAWVFRACRPEWGRRGHAAMPPTSSSPSSTTSKG